MQGFHGKSLGGPAAEHSALSESPTNTSAASRGLGKMIHFIHINLSSLICLNSAAKLCATKMSLNPGEVKIGG